MLVNRTVKSLFMLPALLAGSALCAVSLAFALRGAHDQLAWWGALLANLPLPLLAARLCILQPARTAENEPLLLFVAAAGAFVAAWEFLFEGVSGWLPLAVAGGGGLLLLLYVFWYSRFGRIASGKLDVGGRLPEFLLEDVDGNGVSSRELLGRPAVVMFYGGNWSGFCRAQVAELADRHEELERMGVAVVLISPQPPAAARALSARHAARYRYWVDRDARLARELDIGAQNGVPLGRRSGYDRDTVLPTVVVTNAQGTILFSDQTDNDRVRPEPDLFLAILRRSGAIA